MGRQSVIGGMADASISLTQLVIIRTQSKVANSEIEKKWRSLCAIILFIHGNDWKFIYKTETDARTTPAPCTLHNRNDTLIQMNFVHIYLRFFMHSFFCIRLPGFCLHFNVYFSNTFALLPPEHHLSRMCATSVRIPFQIVPRSVFAMLKAVFCLIWRHSFQCIRSALLQPLPLIPN